MAELVGSAFLSATLQVLFDRLASGDVLNFLCGRRTVEPKLKELRRKLLVLDTVLDDAEAKYFKKEAVKKWLDELKDAVYDAEDLVDEITYQALRCKVEHDYQSCPNQVTEPNRIPTISFDLRMESKLEEMIHRLEDFVKEKDALGLRGRDGGKSHASRLPTTSLVDETYAFGRDSEKEDIINFLLSDDACGDKIGVVPIVGMPGIGKTTLSQIVYNDATVDRHFEIKAWVFVSDDFDIPRISKLILDGITGTPHETASLNQIQVSLKEKLRGKKYLIVMDDVWNDNYEMWEKLRTPLISGARGSKIIATTRNKSVAYIMQKNPAVHLNLRLLSDEDCFYLFSKIAFTHPNLEMMRGDVVKRCKGLPLAAKTLGGLLRSKFDIEEWNDVLKSDLWDLPEDKNNILPALRLSYYYLPSQVKQCFAYCSVFPKGCKFQKEMLVLIWMAQGFVQSRGEKTMEKIGGECFDELVSRSLFQQSDHEVNSKQTYFTMHDLVHDLAQAISGQFSIQLEDDKKLHDIPKIVRHVSFDPSVLGPWDFDWFKALNEAKSLRTFLPVSLGFVGIHSKGMNMLPPLPYLRTLSSLNLPDLIENFTSIRYLNLSYSAIEELPDSICNLHNLQTLLLAQCFWLTTLPSKIGKLICLRHLDISTKIHWGASTSLREMPMQISRLTGLQQLSNYVLGKNGGLGFEGLKELHHLQGSLCISNLQNVTSPKDALVTKLKERALLKELHFNWCGGTNDSRSVRELLENLQPHTNLTRLSITMYGGTTFPDWLGDPSFTNLVTLALDSCEHCFSLPALGQLPSLQELVIDSMNGLREVGPEFYGDVSGKPFQYLKKLKFLRMFEWEEWFVSETVEFSQLQELHISDCPKLTGTLPTRIPFLQKFSIYGCPNVMPFSPLQFYLNLKEVKMLNWAKLESLSISDEHELQNLKFISLEGCANMVSVAQGGLPAPNIWFLEVRSCTQLESLPERMCSLLSSLSTLTIDDCPELESFPEGGLPSNLRTLRIANCKKLVARRREWGIQTLSSLQLFEIRGEEQLESFPDEGLLPSSLTRLIIHYLPNLKLLNDTGLQLLGSLELLQIISCRQLQSLPREDLPNSIHERLITNCPLLESHG
ncbi:putative disease resistance RPP13-like protein 1 [Diospyros lotus]|uniref:putative disease resistance RPP13-like protein 1 n=1 Tax=Diospyros lotus TaxID=55363 RepID=UPI00224F144A|nr:putative disease resistance RPP13-like protein 1 [Diospyros lotus]